MALTLTEAAKLSNDVLKTGVIETIVKESPILRSMPFIEVLGNGLTYNRENAMASAAFYAVGGTWSESTPTFTQLTASLTILGGDADIDNFLAKTRSNVQDLTASVVELKAKAIAHQFEDGFLYGDISVDTNSFDGLHRSIAAGQQVHQGSGAVPAALSLSNLDAMLDLIRPGKPDIILMSRRTRRGLNKFSRGATAPFAVTYDSFGQRIETYNGVPVAVSDFQVDTETIASGAYTAKTGGASSSVFALKFGEDAVAGIQGTDGIIVDQIGNLETKDARRYRIKWYVNFAIFSTLSVAKVDGISSADVTN